MSKVDRPGPPVEVLWRDISGVVGWHDPAQAREQRELGYCSTVGYLIEEDDEGLLIVSGAADFGRWHDATAIPRSAVVSIHRLRR